MAKIIPLQRTDRDLRKEYAQLLRLRDLVKKAESTAKRAKKKKRAKRTRRC